MPDNEEEKEAIAPSDEQEEKQEEQSLDSGEQKLEESESQEEIKAEESTPEEEQHLDQDEPEEELPPTEEEIQISREQRLLNTPYILQKDKYENIPLNKYKKIVDIFYELDDCAFIDIAKVVKDNMREFKFFQKLEHRHPVSHLLDNTARPKHVYEKQYWSYTFFDRVCEGIRNLFSPLRSSPFSLSGDFTYFEKETLYNPQSCPIYVLKSRDIMINNLRRFSRIDAVLRRDEFEDMEEGEFPEGEMLNIKKFLRKRGPKRIVEDNLSAIPTTNIDRHAIPSTINNVLDRL